MSLRVIGENFDKYVTDQINKRQEILNFKFGRSQEQLNLFNSSSPWLKIASSVNVTEDKIRELDLPLSLVGSNLAKNGILFGGKLNGDQRIIEETDFERSLRYDYGHAFSSEFGITPLPILEGLQVVALNQGSLRKATVKIKCFSPAQFQIIETLYLRLKYSMLIEWGHSLYVPNNSFELNGNDTYITSVYDAFINGTTDYESLLLEIELERERRSGNYDAFVGQIVNYDWSLNGSEYDINLQILSAGDVIESLKVNYVAVNNTNKDEDIISEYSDNIVAKKDNSNLNLALYNVRQKMINSRVSILTGRNEAVTVDLRNENSNLREGLVIPVEYSEKYKGPQYYVKLGYLMKLIQDNALLYVNTSKGNTKPYFKCYEDSFYEQGKMFTLPYQFSTNPMICVVDFEESQIFEFEKTTAGGTTRKVRPSFKILGPNGSGFRDSKNKYAGNLYHIFINLEYVVNLLDSASEEAKTELNKVSVFKVMRQLANDINSSLGSINRITVGYDHDTNTAFFYDKTAIPGIVRNVDEVAEFNTVGIGKDVNGKGSFITNLSFRTELSKEVQSAMAIGAIGAPYVSSQAGEDTTFFSTLNDGLVDRILPEKLDTALTNETVKNRQLSTIEQTKERYGVNVVKLASILYDFYVKQGDDKNSKRVISNSDIKTGTNIASSIMPDLCVKESTNGKFIPQGFIPINLTMEMHGLSGIKLFQQFQIDQTILPSSYKGKLNFIVKGINHSIVPGSWTTTLETLTVSNYRFVKQSEVVEQRAEEAIVKTNGIPNPEFRSYVRNTPWSAYFVSWAMKEVGIPFIGAGSHTSYMTLNKKSKKWTVLNPDAVEPQIGDIIVANVPGGLNQTYDQEKYSGRSHGDIVTHVTSGGKNINTIGGNLSNKVKEINVTLTIKGKGKAEEGYLPDKSPVTGKDYIGILRYNGNTGGKTIELIKILKKEVELWERINDENPDFDSDYLTPIIEDLAANPAKYKSSKELQLLKKAGNFEQVNGQDSIYTYLRDAGVSSIKDKYKIQELNPANWERLYEYYKAGGANPPQPFL